MGMSLRCLVRGVRVDGCFCGAVDGIVDGWSCAFLAVGRLLDWGEEIGLVCGCRGVSTAGGICGFVAGIAAGCRGVGAAGCRGVGAAGVGTLVGVVGVGWSCGCGTGVSSSSLGIGVGVEGGV